LTDLPLETDEERVIRLALALCHRRAWAKVPAESLRKSPQLQLEEQAQPIQAGNW
jgi:hypothetical protein